VIVVQQQRDRVVSVRQRVQQRRQGSQRLGVQRLSGGQVRQRPQLQPGAFEGQNKVGQKAIGFGVGFIQRKPGEVRRGRASQQFLAPLHQQNGFAVAGGRDHQ